MTRGDFDPDVDWNDRDHSPEEPDDGFELLPPDYLEAQNGEVRDVEKDIFEPYPGQSDPSKTIDPDDWHH
jgi:hypothetical protein